MSKIIRRTIYFCSQTAIFMLSILCVYMQFSAPTGNVIMEDELEAVNREAAILTAQQVDIIIVLSHVGYGSDMYVGISYYT